MKKTYNYLHCPNCGANELSTTETEAFHCEYCDEDFSFEIDAVDGSNKEFREELKSVFCEKIAVLEEEKKERRALLKISSAKETQRTLECASVIVLILSVMLVFELFIYPIMAIFSIPGFVFFFFARSYRKKQYEKYHPIVTVLASLIAQADEKILVYTRWVSKLSR